MVRRIAALVLLEPALDKNYLDAKANPYEWPVTEASAEPVAQPEPIEEEAPA
jgi:hypothetical protein